MIITDIVKNLQFNFFFEKFQDFLKQHLKFDYF